MKEILNQDDDDDDDVLYIRGTIDRLLPFCKYLQNTRNLTNTLLCCRLHGERGPKKGRMIVVLLPPFRDNIVYGWVMCLDDLLFQRTSSCRWSQQFPQLHLGGSPHSSLYITSPKHTHTNTSPFNWTKMGFGVTVVGEPLTPPLCNPGSLHVVARSASERAESFEGTRSQNVLVVCRSQRSSQEWADPEDPLQPKINK